MFLITLSEHMTILIIYLIDPAFYIPIYFFLCNLSFTEMCHTLVLVPLMLVNLLVKNSARIVMTACATQMNFFIALGDVELCVHMQSVVLYTPVMNRNVFVQFWVFSVFHFLAHITLITSSGISHQCLFLVCVCSHTNTNEVGGFVVCLTKLLIQFLLILVSYIFIGNSTFKIKCFEGRKMPSLSVLLTWLWSSSTVVVPFSSIYVWRPITP